MKRVQITIEDRILEAINQAKKNMQTIESINIPLVEHNILLATIDKKSTSGFKIQNIFGIPVKRGKKLSITLAI